LEAAGAGPEELKVRVLAELEAVRSLFRTAEAFDIEDIIDPADTRRQLLEWIPTAYAAMEARQHERAAPSRKVRP
jgi:propionyl-CoA carboxylase beta chain